MGSWLCCFWTWAEAECHGQRARWGPAAHFMAAGKQRERENAGEETKDKTEPSKARLSPGTSFKPAQLWTQWWAHPLMMLAASGACRLSLPGSRLLH